MFLVMLLNGKRVSIQPITEYEKLRAVAQSFAADQKCHVKVLPMNGRELMNFYGIEPGASKPMSELDPAFRAQAVQNCMDVLRENGEPRERDEAIEMLKQLGALHV